jgi:hypothetical protein
MVHVIGRHVYLVAREPGSAGGMGVRVARPFELGRYCPALRAVGGRRGRSAVHSGAEFGRRLAGSIGPVEGDNRPRSAPVCAPIRVATSRENDR